MVYFNVRHPWSSALKVVTATHEIISLSTSCQDGYIPLGQHRSQSQKIKHARRA